MSGTSGLAIGPMDVDNSSQLTAKLGVHNKGHLLIQRQEANYPEALRNAIARPTDADRTEAVQEHFEDVEAAVRSLQGRQAWLRDGDVIEDVSVHGSKAADRVIVILFRAESGRSGRGVIPYDDVPGIERTLEAQEAQRLNKSLRERGLPVAAADDDERVKAMEERAREAIAAAEQRALDAERSHQALLDRLERLEHPEPFEGYDAAKADEIVKRVKDGGREEFGLVGLSAIAAYEKRRPSPRSTVLDAVENAAAAPPAAAAD